MADLAVDAPAVDPRITSPERAAQEKAAAFADRYHYRITVTITGRIRFLSHLETVDTLLGALRRSGVTLALSEGMRPKPRIKVAMPRPVATEAWGDIVEVELTEPIDDQQFALQLSESLPLGLELVRVERLHGAYVSAASRVAGATWRWTFGPDAPASVLEPAVRELLAADEVQVERPSTKRGQATRRVDVRQYVGDITVLDAPDGCVVRAFVRLTETGSAKPDEVVRALGAIAGCELAPIRTVREAIAIAEPGTGGRIAEPELVGADVPDGPAKPWGAC
jgi:radical SAM-linked protein